MKKRTENKNDMPKTEVTEILKSLYFINTLHREDLLIRSYVKILIKVEPSESYKTSCNLC